MGEGRNTLNSVFVIVWNINMRLELFLKNTTYDMNAIDLMFYREIAK